MELLIKTSIKKIAEQPVAARGKSSIRALDLSS